MPLAVAGHGGGFEFNLNLARVIPSFNFLDTQSLATMCTVLQVPKKRKGFKATVSLEKMESQM